MHGNCRALAAGGLAEDFVEFGGSHWHKWEILLVSDTPYGYYPRIFVGAIAATDLETGGKLIIRGYACESYVVTASGIS
jgi:hypothetical protein